MKKVISSILIIITLIGLTPAYAESNESIYMRNEKCYQTQEEQEYVTERVAEIIDELNLKGKDRANQVISINQWMQSNIKYDIEMWKKNINSRRTAYSALTDGITVCSGYCQLAMEFCKQLDIPCDYVRALIKVDDNAPHGLVMVEMEDCYWYYWDPTNNFVLIGKDNLAMNPISSTAYYNNSNKKVSNNDYKKGLIQLTKEEAKNNEAIKKLCMLLDLYYENTSNYHSHITDCTSDTFVYYELTDANYKIIYSTKYIKENQYEIIP